MVQASSLHREFDQFSRSLMIAFAIGAAISMIVFSSMMVILLMDFRVKVLEARRGRWSFNKSKSKIADASNYVGFQIRLAALSSVVAWLWWLGV